MSEKGSLDNFFDAVRHNLSAPSNTVPAFVRVYDRSLDIFCDNLSNPKYLDATKLLLQSFGGLRSALLLAQAGATNSVNAVLRQAVESAMYAYLCRFDDKFHSAFCATDPSAKQKSLLRSWKGRLRDNLQAKDRKLWELFEGNYNDWIELGAHPSLLSIESLINYIFEDGTNDGELRLSILTGQEERNYAYFSYGNAAIIFGQVFQYIWPNRYLLLNGSGKMQEAALYFNHWMASADLYKK